MLLDWCNCDNRLQLLYVEDGGSFRHKNLTSFTWKNSHKANSWDNPYESNEESDRKDYSGSFAEKHFTVPIRNFCNQNKNGDLLYA